MVCTHANVQWSRQQKRAAYPATEFLSIRMAKHKIQIFLYSCRCFTQRLHRISSAQGGLHRKVSAAQAQGQPKDGRTTITCFEPFALLVSQIHRKISFDFQFTVI